MVARQESIFLDQLVPALEAAADILRIDVVGEDSDQVYELLAGNKLTHFTKLGGVSR